MKLQTLRRAQGRLKPQRGVTSGAGRRARGPSLDLPAAAGLFRRVERVLVQESHSYDHMTVNMSSQLFTARGKRLRPLLTLLWYRAIAAAPPSQHVVRLSAMVEMIHTASVIHDDMIDESSLRRGRDALHVRWGNKLSTLMGDFLYAKSATLIASDGNMDVLDVVSHAVATMCRGEMRELAATADVTLTEMKYMNIIREKTASLCSAACEVGAIMAGSQGRSRSMRARARAYGMSLGAAFQIIDDILDLVSSGRELGKPTGSDVRAGRVTLPLILALRHATAKEQQLMAGGLAKKPSWRFFEQVRALVERYDGVRASKDCAVRLARAARHQLRGLPAGTVRRDLEDLTRFVVERNH